MKFFTKEVFGKKNAPTGDSPSPTTLFMDDTHAPRDCFDICWTKFEFDIIYLNIPIL